MFNCQSVEQRKLFIVVEGRKFLFNGENLVEVSLFFQNMFSGNFGESRKSEIVLKEVDLEEFKFFRDYYQGRRTKLEDLSDEFLIGLIYFADRFMVKSLQDHLFQYIEQRLKKDASEFPYHLIEVFITIGNRELEIIFNEWFYGTKLGIPQFWRLSHVEKCIQPVKSFLIELMDLVKKNEFSNEVTDKLVCYCIESYDLVEKQSTLLMERISKIQNTLKNMDVGARTPVQLKLEAELALLYDL